MAQTPDIGTQNPDPFLANVAWNAGFGPSGPTASTPVNASTLSNPPLSFPPAPAGKDPAALVAATTASTPDGFLYTPTASAMTNGQAPSTAQAPQHVLPGDTAQAAQNYQNLYNQTKDPNQDALVQNGQNILNQAEQANQTLTGKGAAQLQTEQNLGVPETFQQIQEVQKQLAAKNAAFSVQDQSIETNGIVNGVPGVFYQGEQAALRRQQAVEIGALSSYSQALQGNFQLAKDYAQHTVDLQFQGAQQVLDNAKQFLDMNQTLLTDAEQRQATKIAGTVAEQQRILDKQKDARTFAITNGIKSPFYQVGGTIYRTSDGYAFHSMDEFNAAGGSLGQVQQITHLPFTKDNLVGDPVNGYYGIDPVTGAMTRILPGSGNRQQIQTGFQYDPNTGTNVPTYGILDPTTGTTTPLSSLPSTTDTTNPANSTFRTDRNNNPTAMTTAAAAAMGLQLGVDYVQGDPFTDSTGKTLYTAKLLGDPIATTVKAINQGGFTTASGKPRWSYINMTKAQWNGLSADQKAAVVKQMYQAEGGNGSLFAPPSPVRSIPDQISKLNPILQKQVVQSPTGYTFINTANINNANILNSVDNAVAGTDIKGLSPDNAKKETGIIQAYNLIDQAKQDILDMGLPSGPFDLKRVINAMNAKLGSDPNIAKLNQDWQAAVGILADLGVSGVRGTQLIQKASESDFPTATSINDVANAQVAHIFSILNAEEQALMGGPPPIDYTSKAQSLIQGQTQSANPLYDNLNKLYDTQNGSMTTNPNSRQGIAQLKALGQL